jgi:hypothetical protein
MNSLGSFMGIGILCFWIHFCRPSANEEASSCCLFHQLLSVFVNLAMIGKPLTLISCCLTEEEDAGHLRGEWWFGGGVLHPGREVQEADPDGEQRLCQYPEHWGLAKDSPEAWPVAGIAHLVLVFLKVGMKEYVIARDGIVCESDAGIII